MKIVIEMEIDDEILIDAKENKEYFDHIVSKFIGDMRRRAFDALVGAIETVSRG